MASQKRVADYELNPNSVEILEVRLLPQLLVQGALLTSYPAHPCPYHYDYDRQCNLTGLDRVQSLVRKQIQRSNLHEHELYVER
jgi:hypothetical protein